MGTRLSLLKKEISILEYIKNNVLNIGIKITGNKAMVNPCPLCGHRDHFFIYLNNNTFCSFGCAARGGSIVDFIAAYKNITIHAAIEEIFKMSVDVKSAWKKDLIKDKRSIDIDQEIDSYLNKSVDLFIIYCKVIKKIKHYYMVGSYQYKMFDFLESFYDRLSDKLLKFDNKKSNLSELRHMIHVLDHVEEMLCMEFNHFKSYLKIAENDRKDEDKN